MVANDGMTMTLYDGDREIANGIACSNKIS